jgi:hypothetical protein
MKNSTKRLLEIGLGLATWNAILFLFWGGYFFPQFTAYIILLFDVFWAYKGVTLLVAASMAYVQIQAAEHMDWLQESKGFGDWNKVRHIILIMVANESVETYRKTLEALAQQTIPLKQIAVVMATEERFPNGAIESEKMRAELGQKFGAYLVSVHPSMIAGEIKGKSSNEAWAAKEAKRILVDEQKWDMKFITITSNDADAILHKQYFAYLTFKFLDDPDRYHKFWQPAIVFYNNIWRIPAPNRVVNTFSNIWQVGLLMRKDRLVNFANYSATLQMIDEVGYWDTDVIPEDYRIFFKAFFKLNGKVEVEPIFLPSSADAAESSTTWKTFINDYEQKKRWAWGVSDIPLFIEWYLKNPSQHFINKTIRLFRLIEDHMLWPVYWFFITVGVTISTLINPNFSRTAIGYNLPKITSAVFSISLITLVILLFLELRQRPRPAGLAWWKPWLAPFEFILMPVVGFFFGALPGLDAHTRLMLGRYMEYRITEKV